MEYAMNILLIGSGGREHALAWALSASPVVDKLYCAPGNPGIEAVAECVPIAMDEHDVLLGFAKAKHIDFVVIGPEAPLVAGLADRFEAIGIKCLGPSGKAAMLEGSKGFVKDLCEANGIPTALYGRFREAAAAKAFAATLGPPVVVKADGLAAGKGVVIAETWQDAERAIDDILGGAFGGAGAEIVVEEYLDGEEASFFALSDGRHVLPLIGAQDHKRAFDGDAGPNTGGMGAYSPAPVLSALVIEKTMSHIIRPTIAAMAARGTPYRGVLFAGLMIDHGEPSLIEFNCRFGDPECQVLMMRLKSDLATALLAARDGVLDAVDLRWSNEAALAVVMAAKGYPGSYAKGSEIRGLDEAAKLPGVQIFQAGTALKDGKIVAAGGRVLSVTATGKDVREAQSRAYAAVNAIEWPEGFCRRDIGWRALGRGA
jgi:phosphoribosylamine---glycine ligase